MGIGGMLFVFSVLAVRADFAGVQFTPGATPSHFPPGRLSPSLEDFVSVVYLPAEGFERQLAIGWARMDFAWGKIEPQQDVWVWERFDNLIREAHKRGMEVLPLLAYTASWAATEVGTKGPPKEVQDWEDYVEHVVQRYSRPPFNLHFFQVWNEPTRKAGFWRGETDEAWIDTIFIPAAKIIRRYGCQVVFGGWPVSDAQRLDYILEYHDAWRWVDIVDVYGKKVEFAIGYVVFEKS